MKLSEAILLGSTLSPQCAGAFAGKNGSRCALGAAAAAVGWNGLLDGISTWEFLYHSWWQLQRPYDLQGRPTYCDECQERGVAQDLAGMIVHLNDIHCWTRERIAEWVAQFDPPEEFQDIRHEHSVGRQVLTSHPIR